MSFSRIICCGVIGSVKEKEGKMSFSLADNQGEDKTLWYQCFLSAKQTEYYKSKIEKGNTLFIEANPVPSKGMDGRYSNILVFPTTLKLIKKKEINVVYTTDEIPF